MRATPLLILLVTASCSSWRAVAHHESWTLYQRPDQAISADRFAAAFDPAFQAIAEHLGPFTSKVAVHAWDGTVSNEGGPAQVGTGVHEVPGIGPARIQAYHARGGGAFGRSGVFIGSPDAGTAVHELVHARFAEDGVRLPLWFEEGVAGVLGDGLLAEGRWQVDGLACWPLRELREEALSDAELTQLLALDASDDADVRDNVLVHFLGWAIVFDLYRESDGVVSWEQWLAEVQAASVHELRARMDRSLSNACIEAWLVRLADPNPSVRLATAKGLWKLRSHEVFDTLFAALEVETHPEVRVGFAVNLLAAAGELPLSWRRWRAVETAVRGTLRSADLVDPSEQHAALDLYRAYRRNDDRDGAQDALRRLSRFWEE